MGAAFWPAVAIGAFLIWIGCIAVELKVPAFLAKWYRKPGNAVRALTWIGLLFIVLITLTSPSESFLKNFSNDAISIAIAVIVIEELGRYRANLEERERLILQMGSYSNDFALEAARLVKENKWDTKGYLRGRNFFDAQLQNARLEKADLRDTDLRFANLQDASLLLAKLQKANLACAKLQKAELAGAYLQEADLTFAKLQGTDFDGAHLQGAFLADVDLRQTKLMEVDQTPYVDLTGVKYTIGTNWPEGLTPKEAGAILVEWDGEKQDWIPKEDLRDYRRGSRAFSDIDLTEDYLLQFDGIANAGLHLAHY